MTPSEVEVCQKDERRIQVPVPASAPQSEQLAAFVAKCCEDGYLLVGAGTVEGGSQRDPYTVGVTLRFERPT